jgi:predicted nucleic-acid-binding protein
LATGEPAEMEARASLYVSEAFARGDRVLIEAIVLAEYLFVLNGQRMAWSRERQVAAVRGLLELPFAFAARSTVVAALALYESSRAHWVDCFLAARSIVARDVTVFTLDADFQRLSGGRFESP